MNLKPKTLDDSEKIPTFFLPPPDTVFENTFRYGLFGWRKKTVRIHLRWIQIQTTEGKSFYPQFLDQDGFELPNKTVVENYLDCKIELPKIVEVIKHLHHEGTCSKCGMFHIEDNGQLVRIVGNQEQLEEQITVEEDVDPTQHKCHESGCLGWYSKAVIIC